MTFEDDLIQRLKDDEFAREYIRFNKPFIRCKDCKHWIPNIPKYAHIRYKVCNYEYNDGLCEGIGYEWDAYDFCSRGERRGEEEC